jgi:hypothetical protein
MEEKIMGNRWTGSDTLEVAFKKVYRKATLSGTCLIWPNYKNEDGYGILNRRQRDGSGKDYKAYRLAYEFYKGPIPEGLLVRHLCNNPPCINPEHLDLGTHQDNKNDSVKAKRHTYGEINPKAKLTEADVIEIRRLAMEGLSNVEIAKRFPVCSKNISSIKLGQTWRHLA